MRQYYDLYSLLENKQVLDFIGTEDYIKHKKKRFPKVDLDIPINQNQALILLDETIRASFIKRYQNTAALYYNGQPEFDKLLERINIYLDKL